VSRPAAPKANTVKAIAVAALVFAASAAPAMDVAPPPYRARTAVEGVVRIWGNPEAKPLLERWERDFQRAHPQVRFEHHLDGTDVGMAGLYTGQADVVLAGREATASEVKAFEWIYRYRPLDVEVATGSVDQPGRSPALVVYVHRDNPVRSLTLSQLDAAFSRERLRGAPAAATTWKDLGAGGQWSEQPIRLYTFDTETGSGRYFRESVLRDSRMLDWERITEFVDTSSLRNPSHDAGRKILAALAHDRLGLAVASGPPPAGVKAVAISDSQAGPARFATREDLIARRYPLARAVHAYVNRRPHSPLDAPVAEFLRHVLSADGQRMVRESGVYLPLAGDAAGRQAALVQ
jgi:phosphate transport system substrate-binding protein